VMGGDGSNPYQFTGEAWDAEVELLYLRARYYQPEVGRFVTKDPWAGDVWRPGTLNRYVYVRSNPVNVADPSGLQEPVPTPTPTWEDLEEEFEKAWEEEHGVPYNRYTVSTVNRCSECVARGPDPLGLRDIEVPHRPRQGCRLRIIPCALLSQDTGPELVMRAQNPGRGLLLQRTAVYPPRTLWFSSMKIGGASLESGLEVTVRIYMNGAYLEVFDTYDTGNMASVRYLPTFPGMMYRWGTVMTPYREDVDFFFRTVERHNTGGTPVEQGPLDLIPPWQKGKGEAHAWVPADEDLALPSKIRMEWGVTLSRYVSGRFSDIRPDLSADYYDVSLQHLYGDLRMDRCPP
jgi:RHS repeat-associated protein